MNEKPGTHCGLCGKRLEGAYPGADVYCMPCMMEATKHLREKKDLTSKN
jgi:hypothetical protein